MLKILFLYFYLSFMRLVFLCLVFDVLFLRINNVKLLIDDGWCIICDDG